MRATIHLVSKRDYWPFAAAIREPRRRWWERVHPDRPPDMRSAAKRLRGFLADGPRRRKEIEEFLGRERALGVGAYLDLVRVPPSGTWEQRRADLYACAEDWVGPDQSSAEEGLALLVRRYLAAFGPAPKADIADWGGIPMGELDDTLEKLKLRRFRDEAGKELLDLPRAPLPDPDTPAPPRFLPVWDATLLVHCRRTGILPEEYRARIFNTKTPNSFNTFLVDGRVAGTGDTSTGRSSSSRSTRSRARRGASSTRRPDGLPPFTAKELNRATLARQLLLERSRLSVPKAVERLCAVQAQSVPEAYVGLWTRLAGFRRQKLTQALERRAVIRATLFRMTLHYVSATNHAAFAALTHRRWRDELLRKGIPVDELAARIGQLAEDGPFTYAEGNEVTPELGERPFLVRCITPLVHVPPAGTWGHTRVRLTTAKLPPVEPAEAAALSVRRYLGAFGPATRQDLLAFSGLRVADIEPGLEGRFRRFEDEQGRELLDLPRAPRPPRHAGSRPLPSPMGRAPPLARRSNSSSSGGVPVGGDHRRLGPLNVPRRRTGGGDLAARGRQGEDRAVRPASVPRPPRARGRGPAASCVPGLGGDRTRQPRGIASESPNSAHTSAISSISGAHRQARSVTRGSRSSGTPSSCNHRSTP